MEIIFIGGTVLYLILQSALFIGYFFSASLKKVIPEVLPKVTVIIAARNEEGCIANCINSLKNINYPENALEVILVNDNSSDRTKEIMQKEILNLPNFKVIDSDANEYGNLKGKANAINTAIKQSKGDLIFLSDADCTMPSDWVMETIKYYGGKTKMVCGFTRIRNGDSVFASVQALDWIYLQSMASYSSGLQSILSCIGNNLTFTKTAYFEAGGYENVRFSITEDLALMRKISSSGTHLIKYPINNKCLVITEECKTIKELYRQKKRWFKGGLRINFFGWLSGISLYTVNFLLLFGWLFTGFGLWSVLVFAKIISDLLLIVPVYLKFNYKSIIYVFPLFELYFAIYGLLLPLTFLFGKEVPWKGRKF
ncbi:glycosyltransferase [bacterium]|nr:MAG: glycosyltransferase [bacterium]